MYYSNIKGDLRTDFIYANLLFKDFEKLKKD